MSHGTLLGAIDGQTRHILLSNTSELSVGDVIKIDNEHLRIRDIIGRVVIVDRNIAWDWRALTP
jgi:hypothetical protein